MNARVTGTVIIRVRGRSIRSKKGATLKFGGVKRNIQYADGQIGGFATEPDAAEVTATLMHTNDTKVDDLNNIEDETLIFECDSGPVYTVRNAFLSSPPELTGGEGDLKVSFMGQSAVQTS